MQIDFLPRCKCYNQIVHIVYDAILHLIESVILFCVDDSANVVLAKVNLAVICSLCIYSLDIHQVDKVGHNRRSAQVDRHGKVRPTAFYWLDLYDLCRSTTPTNSDCNLVIRHMKHF